MGPIDIVGVLVRCMCSGLAGGLPFVARVALLTCADGLAFIVPVCLWWFPALVPACLCLPNHRVCNTKEHPNQCAAHNEREAA